MGGATILSGLNSGPISLTNFATPIDASGGWVAEGDDGPVAEPTFGTALLSPKTIIAEVVFSRNLLLSSSVDVEAEVGAELLRRFMQQIDSSALTGTGLDNEPLGLLNHTGLENLGTSTDGAAPTWANLVELEYSVGQRAAIMKTPAFLISPKLKKKLRCTPRSTGFDYIFSDERDALMGYQAICSGLLPDNLTQGTSSACSALLFGDMAEVYVGFWGPQAIDLLVDSYTYSTQGKVRLIARAEVGVAVRNIGAFSAYKDILTA
jgi:HK97 family phage major capsid protein